MTSKLAASIALLAMAACGSGRIVAPLRYDGPPAPGESVALEEPARPVVDVTADAPTAPLECPHADELTLPNGLRVVVIERHTFPVVAARMLFEADGAAERKVDPVHRRLFGAAFLTARSDDLEPANGGCGWESCAVAVRAPADGLDAALETIARRLAPPRDDAEEMARRRFGKVSEHLASPGDPATMAELNAYALVTGHRLVRSSEAVTELSFRAVAEERAKIVRPELATLIVAGDTTVDAVRTAATKAFGGWTRLADPSLASRAVAADPDREDRTPRVVLVKGFTRLQSLAAIAVRAPMPARADAAAFETLTHYLGGGLSSDVMRRIREDLAAAYAADGVTYVHPDVAYLVLAGVVPTERTGEALQALLGAVRAVQMRGLTAGELARAKAALLARASAARSSTAVLTGMFGGRLSTDAIDDCERTKRIAGVTAEDVRRVARRYLTDDALHVVVVGAPDAVEPQLEGLGLGRVHRRDALGLAVEP